MQVFVVNDALRAALGLHNATSGWPSSPRVFILRRVIGYSLSPVCIPPSALPESFSAESDSGHAWFTLGAAHTDQRAHGS